MFVIYDQNDQNQTQAINSEPTKSTAWEAFTEIEVTAGPLVSLLRRYGRNSRVTIVNNKVTAVVQFDHPIDRSLANLKIERLAEIDGNTSELITKGFSHGGVQLSLSVEAQLNMFELMSRVQGATIENPIRISKMDGGELLITANAQIEPLIVSFLAAKNTVLNSGRDLRNLINAAATKQALNGIIDDR